MAIEQKPIKSTPNMKTVFVLHIMVLLSIVGCASHKPKGPEFDPNDRPTGPVECYLHKTPTEVGIVKIGYGLIRYSAEYMDAHRTIFPYANDHVDGGCCVNSKKYTVIRYCPQCRAAKTEWLKDHPAE